MTQLSIIAPIYNEEENIQLLYESVISSIKDKIEEYEIILINDGSTDRSFSILEQLAQFDNHVHAIHFEKNYGQTSAIWAGMKRSTGEYIVLLDADLQTDPNDIFILFPYLKEYDFINGCRKNRQDTFIKKISSIVGNTIRNFITNDSIQDTGCPMKLFKREIVDSLFLFEGMHRFLPTLAKMNGFRVIEVPVSHKERVFGTSKYGILNRAFVGLIDAFVVGWLKKRQIKYKIRKTQAH